MSTIRFIRSAGLVGTIVLLAAFSPASASNNASQTAGAERGQTQVSAQRADQNADERRICVREALSGSRMPRRVCKTAQEWEAEGGVPRSER